MRADARANRERLLAVAGPVLTTEGVGTSMRDIARRADVGLATLLRHFPTREALLEALLGTSFDARTGRADELTERHSPYEALRRWLREFVAFTTRYRGLLSAMVTAIEDNDSALHTSCVALRAAGAELLARAQEVGAARTDIDGADLFALVSALAWLGDQPEFAPRAERLSELVMDALTTPAAG
ncbi:TetR/AcrR family transcriptional regulator [Pseudonocardia sp. HH130629-09]|uniref:TetR/AcrR family transcriptional regulator n=1 Tax=Pseudonocardia sp. HH130629-09 TaxID=1641402 RepID=UPI0006CB47D4|nr:TetR/AcrR family transcriptional regulator [Pseudonocardia sp. HH130629-09]ALE84052.1 TetR family transcriptional regulator [Pseudonocardia sp. HH130629-09]